MADLFLEDPAHPLLGLHRLKNNSKGQHKDSNYAVSITMRYRAVYFVYGDANVWYWVGTHADYDRFTGGKRIPTSYSSDLRLFCAADDTM